MDINMKYALQSDKIPTRYLNQLDNSKTPEKKLMEAHQQMIEDFTAEPEDEMEVRIITYTKRK